MIVVTSAQRLINNDKCGTNGHFGPQCRGGPRNTRDKSKSKDAKTKPSVNEVKSKDKEKDKTTDNSAADLGTLNGNWMLISGVTSPQSADASYEDFRDSSSVLRE